MTIKNTSKPINRSVLDKLDNVVNDDEEGPKLDDSPTGKRKPVEPSSEPARSVPKPERKEKKKEKKSAADRREELLKQLKAVENAIAKKRTKINSER